MRQHFLKLMLVKVSVSSGGQAEVNFAVSVSGLHLLEQPCTHTLIKPNMEKDASFMIMLALLRQYKNNSCFQTLFFWEKLNDCITDHFSDPWANLSPTGTLS